MSIVTATEGSIDLGGRLCGDLTALDDFVKELGDPATVGEREAFTAGLLPRRINSTPATVENDLAKLVLALIELVRQLMERQAARRVNAGSLSEDEVEQMGETFLKLDRKMSELRTAFGVRAEDLELSLGPIRDLL